MPARILVIEDEQPLLEEIIEWLRFEGYNPLAASYGQEGVTLAQNNPPDLVISDVMMPEMDGYEVLQELRNTPQTAAIPFIFLTAKSDRMDIRYGMELGADDYITKPFSRNELLNAVHARLERQARVKADAESNLEHLRRTLIYSLPHELHTPLTGILGIGEMLLTDAALLNPSEIQEFAEILVTSGKRLHHLIRNYLLYAQLELVAMEPDRLRLLQTETIDHADHVIEAASLIVAQQHHRAESLHLDLSPGTVRISDNDLEKITTEVVDNAFKFSKSPSVVAVKGGPENGRYRVYVTDQGWGMSAAQIAQIGAYVQFNRALHEQQGAGLGLHLAQRLTEIHNGKLEITSVPGEGTTVCITLPVL